MAKRNQYWLLLLALVLTVSLILSPGSAHAHYYNTAVWNTMIFPEAGNIESNCLIKGGKQIILLGDLPETGKPYDFTLEGTPGTSAPIYWFVDEAAAPYLDAFLYIGDTQLSGGQILTIPESGKLNLTLFLTPVTTRAHETIPASITVEWGDLESGEMLLGGTFQTTLQEEKAAVMAIAEGVAFTEDGAEIPLSDLPAEGLSVELVLTSDKELAQALAWSVEETVAPYVEVTVTLDGQPIRNGADVKIPYDSVEKTTVPVTVTMTLKPTAAQAVHEAIPTAVTVTWGSLQGVFSTHVPELAVLSDTLMPHGTTVTLDPLTEGREITFTLSALADTTAPLTWSVDTPHLNVAVALGDTPLTSGADLTVAAGETVTVTMTLTPGTEARDAADATVQVAWGELLSGTFATSLEAIVLEEDPDPTEPTDPTEPDPAEDPQSTEPEATEPEATEPEATDPEITEPEATEAPANSPMTTTEDQDPTEGETTPTDPTEASTDPSEPSEPEERTDPTDPTESTDPTDPTVPTEPEIPDDVTVTMTTLGHFTAQGMIPVELTVSSNTEHILLSLAASSETASPMGLLPAFTRYTLDGETFYLLYNGGSIFLETAELSRPPVPEGTEPPATMTVLLYLDVSGTDLRSKADLILVAQASRISGDSQAVNLAEARAVLQLAMGDDLTQAMILTDTAPLNLNLPESWKKLTPEHTLTAIRVEEGDDVEPFLASYEVSDKQIQVTRVAMDSQPHVMTLRIGTDLPPAGTYLLTLKWYYQGVCIHETQITFFVNYPVNTVPEETGGADQ